MLFPKIVKYKVTWDPGLVLYIFVSSDIYIELTTLPLYISSPSSFSLILSNWNLSEYFKNLLIAKNCKKEMLTELTGLNEAQLAELAKQKDLLETQKALVRRIFCL